MSYQITSNKLQLSEKTTGLVEEKLKKLEKHIKDVGDDLKDIRVVVDRGPSFGYVAVIELWIPNASFVSKGVGLGLEGAIDDAVEELIRQVSRHKGKLTKERSWKIRRRLKHFLFLSKLEE